ncbi:uncharacterized protein LOC134277992 [Saccostrea cucullata]|uniref:uncharacterized protein LOC134277992 n=1 Tax=Saccostrea cuccullata TaxID=36930 RepID=UPI002ED1106C
MQIADILATIMDVVLDFGSEPVKDVDTKLQILKFGYTWVEEVEKQERFMKEVTEPVLEDKDELKNECQLNTLTTETKEIPREPVLDFGDRPVRNLDEKLQILQFTYSWAERVEEEEKEAKEGNEPTVEQMNKMEVKSKVKIPREERNDIPRETILDFGEGPVTNLEEKLEILKFGYNWSEKVEEEERETKVSFILNQTLQKDTEHQQRVTEECRANPEIAPDNASKTQNMSQPLKAKIGTDKETKDLKDICSKMETQQIKSEFVN